LSTYVPALDGDKRQCRVVASNAGHALLTGIAAPDRAERVADTLTGISCFSGWGIRTLARTAVRYNPISYHNGSVWPHDNALIALGFSRYGLKPAALRIFTGLFDAVCHWDPRRLPELFCGFARRQTAPTLYPVACSPQAWAAATPVATLAASLGLDLDWKGNAVRFSDPILPSFLGEVVIRRLRLGASDLDLRLHQQGGDVALNVLKRSGDARILLSK